MYHHRGRPPAETIHCIISIFVAEQIDALIFGPLSLRSGDSLPAADKEVRPSYMYCLTMTYDEVQKSPDPMVSLLVASHQLRTITIEVLSKALGIMFSNHGIGRYVNYWLFLWLSMTLSMMVTKPWARIGPVRRFVAGGPFAEATSMDEIKAVTYFHASPVMCVYTAMHAISMELQLASELRVGLVDDDPLLSPSAQVLGPLRRWRDGKLVAYWGDYALKHYRKLSPAFREVI